MSTLRNRNNRSILRSLIESTLGTNNRVRGAINPGFCIIIGDGQNAYFLNDNWRGGKYEKNASREFLNLQG